MARYERIGGAGGELAPVYDADGENVKDVVTRLQKRHNQPVVIVDNVDIIGNKYRVILIRGDYKSGACGVPCDARL